MKIKVNVQKIFQSNIMRKQFFLTLEVIQYTKEVMMVKKLYFYHKTLQAIVLLCHITRIYYLNFAAISILKFSILLSL